MSRFSVGNTETQFFTFGSPQDPFLMRSGGHLDEVTIAYETYGTMNDDHTNAVLVFHALTGSQHAAGYNRVVSGVESRWTEECQSGWWDGFIGPGKALDTDGLFVISANYLGGCYGSTGPSSTNPATGRPYGSSFPRVTFADIADSQRKLLKHLGIEKLHAVIGASTGGLLTMSLATRYPEMVGIVIPIASGVRVTALQTLHNLEQITAIENDSNFNSGDYYEAEPPNAGLMLARMIGHKTFVSLEAMQERARGETIDRSEGPGTYRIADPMESYMWHQGRKFVARFDANSYLRISEAWQHFDLVSEADAADLAEVFKRCQNQRYMLFSIDSDVCFYPDEQAELALLLKDADVPHRRITVHSEKGHDSFLLEPSLFAPHLIDTLNNDW
jgi:homoserine O-acetyltransferase